MTKNSPPERLRRDREQAHRAIERWLFTYVQAKPSSLFHVNNYSPDDVVGGVVHAARRLNGCMKQIEDQLEADAEVDALNAIHTLPET
jgi:hypothetical protein